MIKRCLLLIFFFIYFTDCFDKIAIETEEDEPEEVEFITLSTFCDY